MIIVIADDMTGAGEIGGIGLAYGLKTELQRQFDPNSDAQLLIIDTDTRSFSPRKAQQKIRGIARQLNASALPIDWIYKKTDSVLRGPVAGELHALQETLGFKRVLLVPANPAKGRIVRNGKYLINGTPLDETDFANDPEYPAETSNILNLASFSDFDKIDLLTKDQPFPCEEIIVGQAETGDDLIQWAKRVDKQTLTAGAGEFFEAILRYKGFTGNIANGNEYCLKGKALFVCGSSSEYSRQALREAERLGINICRMPPALFDSRETPECFQPWCDEVLTCFEKSSRVVMAIDQAVRGDAEFAAKLRRVTASTVDAVFRNVFPNELLIEGGATASQIAVRLDWKRFRPCNQPAPGVVRMKVLERDHTYLTLKPGSYPWPGSIWNKKEY